MTADLHHMAAAYALNALDVEERRAFEAHYPSCEICASEVAEFREVAGELAETAAVSPPPRLREDVLAQIGETRQLSPTITSKSTKPSRLERWPILAAAAALVLLAGVAVVALRSPNDTRIDDVATAPDRLVTTLEPTGQTDARLQVVWSAERDQVVLIGSDLDALSADQAYALWFLFDDGSVAPAGLFQPGDGSVAQLLDVDDQDPSGWGISVEPSTGSPQPTTPVLFAGNL